MNTWQGDGEYARVLAIDGACGLVPRPKLSKPPGADKPKAKPRPPLQRAASFASEDLRETTRKVNHGEFESRLGEL